MRAFYKNPRILFATGLVGALLLVALWPKSIPVDLAEVRRGSLSVTVDEEGETRVRERFVVSAPISGKVLRIELEPGDPVVRGETELATLEPADPGLLDARSRTEAEAAANAARAGLEQARAGQQQAQADLAFARSELERRERLADQKIVSDADLDAARVAARTRADALRAAEQGVRAAEYQLEMAQARLLQARGGRGADRPITLRSPIDGVVLKRLRESESTVPAGEPLLELGDPARLEIVADFLSSDAVRIKAGDPVHIEQWGGEHALEGRVRRVEPSGFTKISALGVEEQRVNVVVDFVDPVEAWNALGDAYRVELRVVTWSAEDVLGVPTGSLFRSGDDWAVFVDQGGRASLRRVEIGHRNGLKAEVLGGLDAGDRVVLHPSDRVEDGSRIAPRE